jgi:hypothetical protein
MPPTLYCDIDVTLTLMEGKHRDLQRVTVPYAKLVGVVDGQDNNGEDIEI